MEIQLEILFAHNMLVRFVDKCNLYNILFLYKILNQIFLKLIFMF